MMTLYKNMDTNQYLTTKDAGTIVFTWFNDDHASGKLFTFRKYAKVHESIKSKVISFFLLYIYFYM